jgi:hypothetical protein
MTFSENYNTHAVDIWRQFAKDDWRVPLILPKSDNQLDVLVVGINPSFRREWILSQFQELENLAPDQARKRVDELFSWNAGYQITQRLDALAAWESHVLQADNQYYKQIGKFVSDCGFSSWAHIDLFLMRETSQKIVLKEVMNDPIGGVLNEFGALQVDLCLNTIKLAQVRAVFIVNATASGIILNRICKSTTPVSKLRFADQYLYFGGMITGQRAMDRFSKQRFIDQVISDNSSGLEPRLHAPV